MKECQGSIKKSVSLNCDYDEDGTDGFKERNINALVDYDHCLTPDAIHALMKVCYGRETGITTLEDYKTYQQMKEL